MENGHGSREELPLVLVIDDAPDIEETVGAFLETVGFRVAFAKNGFEGVKRAVESSPNVILMDLGMPGMDGMETTRHLKRQEPTKDIPIVAFTGQTVIPDLERAQRKGFNDLLSKPCEPAELVAAIRAALQKRAPPPIESA